MNNAEKYLRSLPRIEKMEEAKNYGGDVFLLPSQIEFTVIEGDLVKTKGLGEKWDNRTLDLIRTINLMDALNIRFEYTNVLTPLAYAESIQEKPLHITTQSILFTKISSMGLKWIAEENKCKKYGRHEFDEFWLSFSRPLQCVKAGDILCIFNRRVNGWDGSHERPVIELLGAGGHLPIVWDDYGAKFEPLSIEENLQKEFEEELDIKLEKDNIVIFGGFPNPVTHELVILCGVKIDDCLLPEVQNYAQKNIDVDTEGIYMGTFEEVIEFYRKNPAPFAGGIKNAPYNFPNRSELMARAIEYMNKF